MVFDVLFSLFIKVVEGMDFFVFSNVVKVVFNLY